MPKKRNLKGLKLTAIAAVDRPCQEGAMAVLFKRADDEPNEESTMKTIEQLQAEVDKLTGSMTALTERAEKAESDMKDKDEECEKLRKALADATDEFVVVAGKVFKRSDVGEASFELAKAAADERDQTRFEKRAETEFANVPGTVAEKVLILKARERMDEESQKALDGVLTTLEKMISAGFDRIGQHGAPIAPTAKAAADQFAVKVQEIAKRDNISGTAAMTKARVEHADLFEQSQGAQAN